MRRPLSLFSVLALGAALLPACGDSDEDAGTEPTDAPATDTAGESTTEASGESPDTSGTSSDDASGGAGEFAGKRICQVLWGPDTYQFAHARHLEEYAGSLGIEVQTIDGQRDPVVQANAIEDCVANGVDGITYQPFDPAGAVAPIKAAQEAGVPVVTWGIKPGDAVTTPFIELNEYETTFEAGVNAAHAVQTLFPGDPLRIVAIDIPTVALCSELRIQGFIDGVMSVDPSAEVAARPDGKGDRLSSTTVMEDIIQADPDFNIVTGCNGEMLLGGLAALEAAGRGKATDGVPESEYLFVVAEGVSEIDEFLDPTSPVVQVMMLSPKDISRMHLDLLLGVWRGEIGATEAYVESIGSLLLPADASCEDVVQVRDEQFGDGDEITCP